MSLNTAVMFGKASERPKRGQATVSERVQYRSVMVGDCLVWQGTSDANGYGAIKVGGRMVRVHRAIWAYVNGPIPDGMEIDHVKSRGCQHRACCRIEHLEMVTHRENILRSDSPGGVHARKTTCPKGHLLAGDNLAPSGLSEGVRRCLICLRERTKLRMRAVRKAKRS